MHQFDNETMKWEINRIAQLLPQYIMNCKISYIYVCTPLINGTYDILLMKLYFLDMSLRFRYYPWDHA